MVDVVPVGFQTANDAFINFAYEQEARRLDLPIHTVAGRHKQERELSPVVANGFDRTALFGFFAACFFVWRRRLFIDERVSAVVVAFEIVRRRLAAQVAVNALVVHVVFARDIFGIAICSVSHKISL